MPTLQLAGALQALALLSPGSTPNTLDQVAPPGGWRGGKRLGQKGGGPRARARRAARKRGKDARRRNRGR